LSEPIDESTIEQILQAATSAPSPANNQPWEFVVITNQEVKARIYAEAEERRKGLFQKSGWKWVDRYNVEFLKQVPVIVCVTGDPQKTGADMFLEGGGVAYQHACAAAIQNMLVTAHSLGLGSLWFTLFEKDAIRKILDIAPEKDPLALICIGKPRGEPFVTSRKALAEKVKYLR
jgi:nitroreductase